MAHLPDRPVAGGVVNADKPIFQVQMKGADVAPGTVRAGDLAEFLVNLEGAITEAAKGYDLIPPSLDEALVSLVRVEHGASNDLTIAVAHPVSPAVSMITEAIVARRFTSLPAKVHDHLHMISRQAIRRRWAYEFTSVNGLQIAPAVISYEFPVPRPVPRVFSGPTVLWGLLVRVGGSEPKAVVRLRNGDLLPIEVTEELARVLGPFLYRDVGIEGTAQWRISDRKIVSFKAEALTSYRPDEVPLSQAFEELRKASQGRWDSVNPDEYVRGLRYEDEV
jgi:hypothetical protein